MRKFIRELGPFIGATLFMLISIISISELAKNYHEDHPYQPSGIVYLYGDDPNDTTETIELPKQ